MYTAYREIGMLSRRATLLLLHHAAFMRTVPQEEHFHMRNWTSSDGSSFKAEPASCRAVEGAGPALLNSCGMTACAGGWAATVPAFRRLGLHLITCYQYGTYAVVPAFEGLTDPWEAVRRFFDLSDTAADYLFHSNLELTVQTPAEWADRAEALVAVAGAPLSVLDRVALWAGFLPRLT